MSDEKVNQLLNNLQEASGTIELLTEEEDEEEEDVCDKELTSQPSPPSEEQPMDDDENVENTPLDDETPSTPTKTENFFEGEITRPMVKFVNSYKRLNRRQETAYVELLIGLRRSLNSVLDLSSRPLRGVGGIGKSAAVAKENSAQLRTLAAQGVQSGKC